MKKTLLLCLILAAVVGGCNKDEKAYKKILGDWKLKSYSVNGIDSLSSYKDSLGVNYNFLYDDYQERNVCPILGYRNDGSQKSLVWYWDMNDEGKVLQITHSEGTIGVGPIGQGKTPIFEIVKLDQDLILKTIYNSKTYIIGLQ